MIFATKTSQKKANERKKVKKRASNVRRSEAS